MRIGSAAPSHPRLSGHTVLLPTDRWHEIIGDPTIADAILDRLVHTAYRINLSGESLRKSKVPEPAKPTA